MRICGFSFIRNAVRFDYPFEESIRSALPLCDEFVLAVGWSEDDTLARARAIDPAKVRIVETVWDDSLRRGGAVLAQQTDIALAEVRRRGGDPEARAGDAKTRGADANAGDRRPRGDPAGGFDWALYLQADEVLHERDHPAIRESCERWLDDRRVEGLLFDYVHFCGGYGWIGSGRDWYRREVRIVRPGIPGLASWKDAQGFRVAGRKLAVKPAGATVHHYGWVKPPAVQREKLASFERLWHMDEDPGGLAKPVAAQEGPAPAGATPEYDYSTRGRLVPFTGTHPAVMGDRVAAQAWRFEYDPRRGREPLGRRLLDRVESWTGIRVGEYRNYRLI